MTNEEMHADIGRAFVERRDLLKKVDCLKHRLRTVGAAATTLSENPVHADSEAALLAASDIREDFAELKQVLSRLAELDRVLS
ncbi:MAG: hypothetical protein F4160_05155 [Rhodospirillaceae bacterium]|nr:hypothetical protein [Rhodospirillaceae bacterium]